MKSVVALPRCHASSGPRCDLLIRDPESALAERENWPDHYCVDVGRYLTRQWAERRARLVYGSDIPFEVRAWIQVYPLPVGAWFQPGGLIPALRSFPFGSQSAHDVPVPRGLSILPTIERVALALHREGLAWEVTAFGVVDHDPTFREEIAGECLLLPATPQVITTGACAANADDFRANFERWWSWLGGKQIEGRPKGMTVTQGDIQRTYQQLLSEWDRRPTQLDVATKLLVSEKTIRRAIHPLEWREFTREVLNRIP